MKMGKSPLTEQQVKSLRKLVAEKPLHSLLLNLSVDLMLRASDLLSLRVKDVMNESGTVKKDVKVKQKKTRKSTLFLPLSKNSIEVIKLHLTGKEPDQFIFVGQKSHYTNKPISIIQYSRIVKKWMKMLGVENLEKYSTHSLRKTKSSVIYKKTQSVEICRRLLGQSSVTATSAYLGIEDNDALEVARNINI
jgi:integrase